MILLISNRVLIDSKLITDWPSRCDNICVKISH